MTDPREPHEPLERLLERAVRDLPPRRAPRSLEARVLAELARRAALPWWHRSFAHWPAAARAGFAAVGTGLLGLALFAGVWASAALGSLQPLGTAAPSWARPGFTTFQAFAQIAAALRHAVPPEWLYGILAASVVLYGALFGLGAAAYRTLFNPNTTGQPV